MKSAIFYREKDIRVEEVKEPMPGAGEVLIGVRAAGICGSDLHRYRGHDPWGSAGAGPRRAGHELAGEIVAVGPDVDRLTIGQRVAVEPMQLAGCGRCRHCRRDRSNVCPRRGMFGGQRWTSAGFAELDLARQDHVFPLADHLSYEVAALADVYACAVHAIHRTRLRPADTVAVIGTGPVGLATAQVARATGARRTYLIGRRREAADVAARICGADHAFSSSEADDLGAALREVNDGEGADIVFEAVGGDAGALLPGALAVAGRGATVCLLGAFVGEVGLPFRAANEKEITLCWSSGYASWSGRREFQLALDGLTSGRLAGAPLVTHRFSLDAIGDAFAAADDKRGSGAIKVMIEPASTSAASETLEAVR